MGLLLPRVRAVAIFVFSGFVNMRSPGTPVTAPVSSSTVADSGAFHGEDDMGHRINALIGSPQTLAGLAARLGPPEPTRIAFGLSIVPLDEQRMDAIATSGEPAFEGFTYLDPGMAAGIAGELGKGSALYIETDYFGGAGRQGAALFEDGALVWRRTETTQASRERPSWFARFRKPAPRLTKSPISEGLARLGVVATARKDEFDLVGLGGFRSLEGLGFDED